MLILLELIGAGLLLYFGAEWLVSGSASLALSLRIPQLIVGLTVVAYGTSMPEVVVSIQAALSDHAHVALGNVVGSNIANLGLILGLSALIQPARVDGGLRRREIPILVATTIVLPFVFWDGVLARWEAMALFLSSIVYTVIIVRSSRRSTGVDREAREAAQVTAAAADDAGAPALGKSRARMAMIALAGLLVLLLGGHLFVRAAVRLAIKIGMSEHMVGLTIVAIGTSLPELITSLIAAKKGHSDIAVGNVIGSNIFNILLCLGLAGLFGRITATPKSLWLDLTALILLTLLSALFMRTARTLKRIEAGALLGIYIVFICILIGVG